ncbi:PEP-CTERM sorting domain-containing protein [Oxalobacteraceae bacterium A2-2]
MTLNKPLFYFAAAAALLCSAVPARATHFVEFQGATLKFFVDSDYFDLSRTTVIGNSISFDLDPQRYSASVTGTRASSSKDASFSSTAGKALYIVANDGYSLVAGFSSSAIGEYSMTGLNGGANAYVQSQAFLGAYTNGKLTSEPFYTAYSSLQLNRANQISSGPAAFVLSPYGGSTTLTDVLGISTSFSGSVYEKEISSSSLSITRLSYSFSTVADAAPLALRQVSPVPEPGTYAMLVGGLAMLGALQRRRKA